MNSFKITALYCLTYLLAASVVNADSETESAIVSEINQQLELSKRELQQVVGINSGTLNFEGVKQVGSVFQNQLEKIGFDANWIDGSGFNRAGHLVASHGDAGPRILLIGHLDTVFSKDDAFQAWQVIDEDHVKGPGITDMKGGDVIIVSALRALKNLGLLDGVQIRVVMTGDEESSGEPLSESKAALIEAAIWADIALGFEDGDGNIETAVIARRGSVDWQLDVQGKAAHSSQIFQPEVGVGAIFEVARILNEFRQQLAGVGNLSFNPGMIVGGTTINHDPQNASADAFGKNNVIAKSVRVVGGIRALSSEELEHAQGVMQEIVSQNLPHTSATLSFGEGYPPMAPSEGNKHLLAQYSDISQSLGYGEVRAVNPRKAGAADISFTAGHVEMALDGLGLMGTGGHTKTEVAHMPTFTKNIHKAAILIYRLGQQDESK